MKHLREFTPDIARIAAGMRDLAGELGAHVEQVEAPPATDVLAELEKEYLAMPPPKLSAELRGKLGLSK